MTTKTDAHNILETLTRRMAPARPPWHNDPEAIHEWVNLFMRYTETDLKEAWRIHTTAKPDKWPTYFQIRQLLRTRHRAAQQDIYEPAQDADVVPASVGLAIAWDAYCEQCAELGKTPNEQRFNKWLKQTG